MLNLKELKNSIYLGEWGENLLEYYDSSDYVSDAIMEVADDLAAFRVDITDIEDRAYWMEEAVNEGFIDLHDYSYSRHEDSAVFLYIEDSFYSDLKDILTRCAIEMIENDFYELIDDEGNISDELEKVLDDIDGSEEEFSDIYDSIQEIYDSVMEEEEE